MVSEKCMLLQRGDFSRGAFIELLFRLDSILTVSGEPMVTRKVIHQIAVEAIENIIRHRARGSVANDQPGFGLFRRGNEYNIITTNRILGTQVPFLKKWIDQLNLLDPAGLKDVFLTQIRKATTSPEGNAGLGLILMARKSGNKIQYEFPAEYSDFPCFQLNIRIDRTTPV